MSTPFFLLLLLDTYDTDVSVTHPVVKCVINGREMYSALKLNFILPEENAENEPNFTELLFQQKKIKDDRKKV